MIARKTGGLHVHVFGLDLGDSILETRDLILETIEDRVLSLKARGTVNLLLSSTVSFTKQHYSGELTE